MEENKQYTFKKIMTASVWIQLGAGLVVLLVAAISKKDTQLLNRVEITIKGVQNHYFINKEDVKEILEKINKKPLNNAMVSSLDLVSMEKELQKEKWIKNAEIFIDNNNVLQVKVTEREPVARIFTTSGASFYLDSSLMRLPLGKKFSARLPVFTSFPTDVIVLKKADSILLRNIKVMSEFIEKDEFWMAQIDQIDITENGSFELIPKVGNQIIRFGDMQNYQEKFNNLLAFYRKVQVKAGWNKYSVLDLQYRNQVVAVKRDAIEIKADSLKAIQIMKKIIEDAKKKTSDTTNIQLKEESKPVNINRSRVIEEVPEDDVPANLSVNLPAIERNGIATPQPERRSEPAVVNKPSNSAPVVNRQTATSAVQKKEVKKETTKKQAKPKKETPKAVMPKAIMPPAGENE